MWFFPPFCWNKKYSKQPHKFLIKTETNYRTKLSLMQDFNWCSSSGSVFHHFIKVEFDNTFLTNYLPLIHSVLALLVAKPFLDLFRPSCVACFNAQLLYLGTKAWFFTRFSRNPLSTLKPFLRKPVTFWPAPLQISSYLCSSTSSIDCSWQYPGLNNFPS